MSWVKLDDRFPRHRRVRELRRDTTAKWLHVVALCHCAEHLTDGLVDDIAFTQIVSDGEIARSSAKRSAARLEEVGLWVRNENGWTIRDYLDYNPASEAVKAKREARAEAGRLGGIQSGASRRIEANSEANASALLEASVNPVPVPVPQPVPKEQDPKTIARMENILLVRAKWSAHAPPLIVHRDTYLEAPKTSAAIEGAIRIYPVEAVVEAVENYATVLGDPGSFWFAHSWTIRDFLQRGLDKFSPEARPLENFRIRANGNGNGRDRGLTVEEMRAKAAELRAVGR